MSLAVYDESNMVGMLVYERRNPRHAGKILSIVHPKDEDHFWTVVKVKWIDGQVSEIQVVDLNNFKALVEETQHKLNTHLDTLKKLQKLG